MEAEKFSVTAVASSNTPESQFTLDVLLRKRRSLRRELLQNPNLIDLRIAILGGSTTNEFAEFLEILLLAEGFRCEFYQSEYGKYFEDAVFETSRLSEFKPDIVHVHTSSLNIRSFPPVSATEADFQSAIASELSRFETIWQALTSKLNCQIVQNNFELPPHRVLGNLDATSLGGRSHFIAQLNLEFARKSRDIRQLLIHDLHALAASLGDDRWFDPQRWFSYKIPITAEANLAMARSLTSMVRAIYGRSRKCLVLDLDNTLWGGVIGDDGPDNIVIGRETPVAEAYTAFQEYCLALRERGILLAVCSKNDESIARQGFQHPDSVLKLDHFSAFVANWEPKHENLIRIAQQLNIGLNSLVFVDDNPAERAIVAAQLPVVAVPDVGSDVTLFPQRIEGGRYFETVALSAEDIRRADAYADNARRDAFQSQFRNYGEYLDSLKMTAEIDAFKPAYLERITQLTNKTNQFNLTTKRYTQAEIQNIASSNEYVTLYGRLSDSFGDHGLVSVIIGRIDGAELHLDLWLMSCRVLKRGMESAMLDKLTSLAKESGIGTLRGYYYRTPKNEMVRGHYKEMGFECISDEAESSVWKLHLDGKYVNRNNHISVSGNDQR